MSNVIGDLFWNYFGVYLEMIASIPATLIKTLAKGAIDEAKREIALKSIDETQFKTPEIREAFRKLKASWQHSPEGGADIAHDLINIVVGKAAQVQLENIAGIQITDEEILTKRLFDQIAIITDVSLAASILTVIGSFIPATNAQYMGIVLREYMQDAGVTQVTGFGYGMLFSNVISPLMAYELNKKIRPSLPASSDAIRLGYRQLLTPDQVDDVLSKQGYSDAYIEALQKGFEFYPTPQDFISFAVRETFREDIVLKYQYDADYPTAIDDYVLKAGLTPFWTKHYWRAHWQLPSINLGYEMLHRDIIGEADLITLLKIGDIAPWWIPKLVAASYSPYTRVDTRRLYTDGILTREQVKRNYKDIGYDEEHAENLTVWTCKAMTDEKKAKTKDLTEAAIIRAYRFGQVDASATSESLTALGYDEDEAALILSLADYQTFEDELAGEYAVLKDEFSAELKTEAQVKDHLSKLKLSQREQERWIRQLKRDKRRFDISVLVAKRKKEIGAEVTE
jgi:hypothetical protein